MAFDKSPGIRADLVERPTKPGGPTPGGPTIDTRGRIVEAARDLFGRNGYSATSVSEICAAAEARSGSLYHFFESKEDVLAAVLELYLELLGPLIVDRAAAATEDAVERVFAMLDVYRAGLIDHGFRFACPIGRIALEVSDPSERVRALLAENFACWAAAVEQFLTDAGERLPPDVDRAGLARFVLTVMEGSVMQSATARSIEPFDAAVAQLRAHLTLLEASAAVS